MNVNRAIRRLFWMTAAVFIVCAALLAWYFLRLPSHPAFSRELSLEEQHGIAAAVHSYSLHKAFQAFTSGRFDFALERLKTIPRTVVYSQGKHSDGKIWVNVGVPDSTQQDGYRNLSRHMIERREDGWAVVTDF